MLRAMLVPLQLLTLSPQASATPEAPQILNPHDLIVVGLCGVIRTQAPRGIAGDTVIWTLSDQGRRTATENRVPWTRVTDGDTVRITVTAPRYGLFLLALRHSADSTRLRTTVAFVPRTTPDPRLGLHLYDLRWLPPIGVGSVRLWDTHTMWADIEPGPHTYHWDRLDSLITGGTANGVRILLTLGMAPRWASSQPDQPSPYGPAFRGASAPPRSIDDWKSILQVVLKRYAGRLEAIELWNEPNYAFLIGGARAEAALLAAGTDAVHTSGVKVTTVGPALAGHFIPFFDSVAMATGLSHPDVFSMHTYTTGPTGPEVLLPQLRETRAALAHHGWSQAIWVTEAGYWLAPRINGWPMTSSEIDSAAPRATAPNWLPAWPYRPAAEDSVASFLVRQYAMYLGNGIERVCWYAWTNRIFGLTDTTGAPRAPVVAFAGLATRISGLGTARSVVEGPSVYAYRFSNATHNVTVAWSINPGGTNWVPSPQQVYSEYDVWGNLIAPTIDRGMAVSLSATPVYLESVAGP